MNELQRIVRRTRSELVGRKLAVPPRALERRAEALAERPADGPFESALGRPGLSLIAEHKRRSPSAGLIREGVALADVVGAYERAGACALSILTEAAAFGGSLDDLALAREITALPILRKDFIVERYQLLEALVAGADAILLIVAALEPAELEALYTQAGALGLGVLVEAHDARELDAALALGPSVIGINNRDLTTLRVDVGTTHELLPRIPAGVVTVAESGFRTRTELEQLAGAGVNAVLVGEALMRSPDIEAACRELAGIGL